jgi:cytochrome oxidase Cu insertion factor (SCO1/SenC/PrrC family)
MRLSAITGRRALLSGAAVSLVLAATFAAGPAVVRHGRGPAEGETSLEKIAVYGQVPEFSLIERSGRPVTRADLLGKVWLANFIYSECKETCPLQSLQLSRLQAEFADAPDLRLVSITVDPKHDTPEVLARYAERYGADPERWLFLTGDKREIYCLAKDGFRLSVVDQADPSPPPCRTSAADPYGTVLAWLTPQPAFAVHGSQGLFMHSARLVLVDRDARIRAYHLATDEDSLKRLRPNLRELLAERRTEK